MRVARPQPRRARARPWCPPTRTGQQHLARVASMRERGRLRPLFAVAVAVSQTNRPRALANLAGYCCSSAWICTWGRSDHAVPSVGRTRSTARRPAPPLAYYATADRSAAAGPHYRTRSTGRLLCCRVREGVCGNETCTRNGRWRTTARRQICLPIFTGYRRRKRTDWFDDADGRQFSLFFTLFTYPYSFTESIGVL